MSLGDLQHAHLLHRITEFVEDAEHGVAVDDELRHVGNGGGIAFHLDATRHARHEIAQRFAEVEQLAQLHADPCRVDHAHVEAQHFAQSGSGLALMHR